MTDEELLRCAAKAAGFAEPHSYRPKTNSLLWLGKESGVATWRPLDDDAEAFKLMVQLGIRDYFGVEVQKTCVQATAFEPWEHCEYEEYKEQDPCAAARRAIVRAAAQIGKEMK